jgi:dsDNA-specific endonuclease/ATPase MutS2
VTATPPAIWFNATNLRTLDELGFDIDPETAIGLAVALVKAAALASCRSDPTS